MRLGTIAFSLVLACLPVQLMVCEDVWAQVMMDRKAEGDRLIKQGIQQFRVSEYQLAIQSWEQALQIYREIKDLNGEGKVLNNLGSTYISLGQYQKAIDFLQQSLVISKQISDLNGEGKALNNLGEVYRYLGQYQKAIDFLQQSLVIFKQIGDRNNEGKALGNLGNAYYSLGQYEKAKDFFLQSLVVFERIGDRNGEGKALNNLGNTYNSLRQYQNAIDFLQRSLVISEQIGDRYGEANTLNNLGNAYDNLGQYKKAIDFFKQSLGIYKQIGDRNGEGASLNNLGNTYSSLKEYQKAIDFYQQSLGIYRQIGDYYGKGRALGNLGTTYNNLGQYQKAIDFLQQSLVIKKQIGDRNGEGSALDNLGNAYDNLGQYQKAINFYQQSLVIYRQIGDRKGEEIALSDFGFLFSKLSQPELAILFYKQAVNVTESIRKDIRALSKEEQKSYLDTVISRHRHLADRLLRQNRVMEALQVLDLLKVQDLQDFLKDIKGNERTALGVEMLPQEQKFLNEYNTIQDRAVKLGAELTDLRKLPTRTPTQQQRLNQIEQIQAQVNQELTAHLQSASTKALIAQIQQTAAQQNTKLLAYKDLSAKIQRLGSGTALFYPLILSDRIELVLFIPNRPPIHRAVTIKQAEVLAEIKTFRQQLEARNPNIKAIAQNLYQKLIAPIEPELKAAQINTIIYAPDGQMRYVPLAALHDGKQWLVERYLVNNVTAVSLTNLDPNPQTPSKVLAGAFAQGQYQFKVGEKNYDFSGLKYAGIEVATLARTIPNTIQLIDREFNRDRVLPNMKTSTIVHLATHAEFVQGSPEDSFIVLGNGDRINLREIGTWNLPNISLIVLSACQTAIGDNLSNGIEILGFGYQLQRAKVRAAIASLWKVDDPGTQQLMESFYKALKTTKVSHAEALRQAMITGNYEALGQPKPRGVSIEPRLRAKPSSAPTKLTHPYYWAPFIMIGNGL